MTPSALLSLSPLIVLAGTAVILMLTIAFYRSYRLAVWLTVIGLVLALVAIPVAAGNTARGASIQVTPLLVLDNYAFFFVGLLVAASLVVTLLSYSYLENQDINREEYYLLLLLATLGAAVLAASSHFASFFLGLEILSISLYVLIAYLPGKRGGIEAGVKYLILAAASSAFLLFGMALVYAVMGSMDFTRLASPQALSGSRNNPVLLAGLAMMMVGVGFKLALAPFHMWTADVYQGAPAPVTAFVATISKGSVFAILVRFFSGPVSEQRSLWLAFGLIAAASMLGGNLLALLQNNVKRILAYSSIAHLGYLLVAFLAGGTLATLAVTLYLVTYFVTTLGAFGVVTVLSGQAVPGRSLPEKSLPSEGEEAERLEDYRGLSRRRPWLAGIFAAMLFSLAGIPLTAGFVGKFYLVAAGVGSAEWALVILLLVASAIGLFYYLRLVITLFSPTLEGSQGRGPRVSLPGGLALGVLAALLVGIGIFPAPLIHLLQELVVRSL